MSSTSRRSATDDRRDPQPSRRPSAGALYCRRQGDPGLPRRGRRGGSAGPEDEILDSTSSQLAVELAKVRAHGVAFEREESLLGFGCVAAPIGGPGEAVAAVSVCGPMNRMMFDQRLTAPVRMTAMGIWRNVEDGPQRVAPTLQPLRPLLPRRPAPLRGPPCSTREPRPTDRHPDRGVGRWLPAGPHHDWCAGKGDHPLPIRAAGRARARCRRAGRNHRGSGRRHPGADLPTRR